ncbi:MAG TPA: alpha/beta hydrolase [Actinomycetota bacterium]|nr:alpha/beta hydrolase [Actinomycetota bacterium]
MRKGGFLALAGAAAGVGAGLVAQRSVVNRRRRNDPEAGEPFGKRRGERDRVVRLTDGAGIYVEEAGPSSPRGALFIHGSALRTDVWHYQLPGIGGHRLVFCDLRGHGRSYPKGELDFTIENLAGDVEAVLDDAELDEAVIVGHSIGGMIALQFAAAHQEWLGSRIKGLVLLNTTYRPAYDTSIGGAVVSKLERVIRHPLDALGGQHDRIERLRKIVRPTDSVFLAVAFAAFGPHASAKQIDFTYDMTADTSSDVLFDLVKSYRDYDVTDALTDVTVPVLVMTGTHDRLTIPKASEYLAQNLPKAELQVFERSGHMTMLERHEEFNAMLDRFLTDVLGDPSSR